MSEELNEEEQLTANLIQEESAAALLEQSEGGIPLKEGYFLPEDEAGVCEAERGSMDVEMPLEASEKVLKASRDGEPTPSNSNTRAGKRKVWATHHSDISLQAVNKIANKQHLIIKYTALQCNYSAACSAPILACVSAYSASFYSTPQQILLVIHLAHSAYNTPHMQQNQAQLKDFKQARRPAAAPETSQSGDESDGYGEGGLSWEAVLASVQVRRKQCLRPRESCCKVMMSLCTELYTLSQRPVCRRGEIQPFVL